MNTRLTYVSLVCLLLSAGTSCIDQLGGGACSAGTSLSPGPSCAVATAAIVIDGTTDEWRQSDAAKYEACPQCAHQGAVQFMHVARDGDSDLLIYLELNGTPLTAGDRYVVQFLRPDMEPNDPDNTVISFIFYANDFLVSFNRTLIRGMPVAYEFSAAGLEMRIPLDLLPYPGAAKVVPYLILDDGSTDAEFLLLEKLCWDPNARKDHCSV